MTNSLDAQISLEKELSCIQRVKRSRVLVVVLVCTVMFTDSLLLTLVDPILPKILDSLENPPVPESERQQPGSEFKDGSFESVRDGPDILPRPDVKDDLNYGGKFGYLVAAKGAAQFVCNPFVGHFTSRFGYRHPMLFGSVLLAASTIAFAYSINYWMLMVTRLIQGLASSFTAVSSLGLLADTFRDDEERGKVVGYAFGGLSLGIIAGPVYGSMLYDFVSPKFPFQLLACIVLLSGVAQIFTYQKQTKLKREGASHICKLARDPYIIIVALNIFLLNLDGSVLLAFMPLNLMRLANPPTWQLGIVVLPSSIGYMVAGVIFPRIVKYFPRWLQGLVGMFVSSGTLMALAYSDTFVNMMIVTAFLGLTMGMISTSMQPIFAYLVDIRHSDVYGNVYAISDMSVCLAMFLGPLLGGPVLYAFSYQTLLFAAAVIDLVCAPLSILLRKPTPKNNWISDDEKKPLVDSKSLP
ncbi:synaptic vesicular amine transporter-like [Liolophura sinensis]|uniref:synaptic vesicular amine transporter-like n=1 Tax=Liolophura sinensis TaxID=3198878 RepID=UPI003158500F